MPIENIKFSPKSYDSVNNSPPWRDFTSQFESFVMYQTHGAPLIALIDHILQRERALIASSEIDEGILLTPEQISSFNRGATAADGADQRQITQYSDLRDPEKVLDAELFNILDSCISGPLRTALHGVQVRSFIQGWVLLQKDKGAHNSQRKTELIMKLLSIEFRNLTPTQFKASNLSIVREVYDARVTLEDIIMTSIMNSLPREYDNAKIALASKIDDDSKDDKDVYEYIQHTTNILELIHPQSQWELPQRRNKNTLNALKASQGKVPPCSRCGRKNHKLEECFASRHVDGTKLKDAPPNGKPSANDAYGASKPSTALNVTTDEERTQCLDEARQILRRMESM